MVPSQDSNPQPVNRKSVALPIAPPRHAQITIYLKLESHVVSHVDRSLDRRFGGGVAAGESDGMQPAYDRIQAACRLYTSLVRPRL